MVKGIFGRIWDYIQSPALEPHNISSPIFWSYFICFHITTKICAFSFCCSKGQRQPTFLNLNFQIIIAFCLLGVTFFSPLFYQLGDLLKGIKREGFIQGKPPISLASEAHDKWDIVRANTKWAFTQGSVSVIQLCLNG